MRSILSFLLLVGCVLVSSTPVASRRVRSNGYDPVGPDTSCITFYTDVTPVDDGAILIDVKRSLSPFGADRLYALIQDQFFSANGKPAAFFRVVPNFVVQFGISGEPNENLKWNGTIPDDPVMTSNTVGTLTFATAGPNTRTTQLFINYANNTFLDSQGFSPFGTVVKGMANAVNIFNPTPGSSDGVDQDAYAANGAEWIEKTYPGINSITKATAVSGKCQV
mgnify:CR=1 FL=1